jgi:hypothetical protein
MLQDDLVGDHRLKNTILVVPQIVEPVRRERHRCCPAETTSGVAHPHPTNYITKSRWRSSSALDSYSGGIRFEPQTGRLPPKSSITPRAIQAKERILRVFRLRHYYCLPNHCQFFVSQSWSSTLHDVSTDSVVIIEYQRLTN